MEGLAILDLQPVPMAPDLFRLATYRAISNHVVFLDKLWGAGGPTARPESVQGVLYVGEA